jgi:hypothetical protein
MSCPEWETLDPQTFQHAQLHSLYVAATRVRDRLMLSGILPRPEFLDDIKQPLDSLWPRLMNSRGMCSSP